MNIPPCSRRRPRRRLLMELLETRLPLAEDAFEPNDSFSDVDSGSSPANFGVLSDIRVERNLALEDTDDYFRFETTETGTSHDFVQIEFIDADGNLNLELYDASRSRVGRSTSLSANVERVSLATMAAGVYYARVIGAGGDINSNYGLTIDPPGNSTDDFYEPNESLAAVALEPVAGVSSPNIGVLAERTQINNLRLEDPEDWFRFETTGTGNSSHFVQIEFDDTYGNLDLEILDESGARFGRSTSLSSDIERVSLATAAAGVYYARVYGGGGGDANADYALSFDPPISAQPSQPEVMVEVDGVAVVSGQQDPIIFDDAALGGSQPEIIIRVINNGAAPLLTDNLVIPNGFSLAGTTLDGTIGAGQSDSFRVQLVSGTVGTRLGEVRFATNDSDESEFKLLISGTVTPTTDENAGDVFEQNDDRLQVSSRTAGENVSANFGVVRRTLVIPNLNLSDDDWYRFETTSLATSNDFVQIEFIDNIGNLDLEIFDDRGNRLGRSTSLSANLERVSLATLPAGVYFARVFGVGGDVNPNYALTIDPPGNSADDFYEPNEDRVEVDLQPEGGVSSPNLGVLGQRLQINNLRSEDSEDWFRFETTGTGTSEHFVQIEFDDTYGNLDLEILDANGDRVDRSTSLSADIERVSLATLDAGVYYARVYAPVGDANADYGLTINPPSSTVPAHAEVTLQVDGITIISGQRDPLAFDNVAQGNTGQELVFTVANSGSVPLLTDRLTTPDGFSLTGTLDGSIDPGQSDTFRLRLQSDRVGTRFGEVRFATNDPDESEWKFWITGTVTPSTNTSSGDIFEENDDRFTVLNQSPGEGNASNLGVLGQTLMIPNLAITDDDWFRFETTAVGTSHDSIRIEFDDTDGNLDLELYDDRGNRIDRSTSLSADIESFTMASLLPGTYYVRVFGVNGDINPNYSLTIDPPGNSIDDRYEPNEDRMEVDLRPVGAVDSPHLGTLGARLQITDLRLEDSEDWFRFETTGTGTAAHSVSITFDDSFGNLDLEVLDANGDQVGRSTSLSADIETVSLATERAGVYYARVYGGGGEANDNYSLTIDPPTTNELLSLGVAPVSFDEADGAGAATGTVTRSGNTAGELTVVLDSSDISEARVPNVVVIPAGQSQQTFAVAAIDDDDADGSQDVRITASAPGFISAIATITVTDSGDVNLPPTISDIADLTIDGSSTTGPLDFTISDTRTAADLLSVTTASSNPSLVPLSGISLGGSDSDRTITVTPIIDQVGTATITVTVADPEGLESSDSFVLTVEPANARPFFAASDPAAVLEDSGAQTFNDFAFFNAGAPDESNQSVLAYHVDNVSNPSLFATGPAVDVNGTLTFEPAADAFGFSTLELSVQDNGGTDGGSNDTSEVQVLTINVTGVNDAPEVSLGGPVTVDEDGGAQSIGGYAQLNPGPLENSQSASASINNLSHPLLFASGPQIDADGNLTFTPADDVSGTATFDVVAQDNGGTSNNGVDTSAPVAGTITIQSINDAPTFTATDPPAVLENSGPQTISGVASNFDPGPEDESGQTIVAYNVSNVSNAGLFASLPVVDTAGNLHYSPAAGRFGTSTFDVAVQDSGGTARGGVDMSAAQRLTITVKEALVLSWDQPSDIFFGAALGGDQLNASANLPGTFVYTPAAGTQLPLGDAQTLSVTFTADDAFYDAQTRTVTINVVPPTEDYGDAPSNYPVTIADQGASHTAGGLTLGSAVDAEADGQPSAAADADGSDDDGVAAITDLISVSGAPTVASFTVIASEAGLLDAWIDFRGNGDWNDPGEQVAASMPVVAGSNTLSLTIPGDAVPGITAARFRLSSSGSLAPTGPAGDGEVEDYLVTILDGVTAPDANVTLDATASVVVVDNDRIVAQSSGELFNVPTSGVGRLTVRGGADDDTIAIDFSEGDMLPTGGLQLDGGGGSNTLVVAGADTMLDLTNSSLTVENFSMIDLGSENSNEIIVDPDVVAALEPVSNSIMVVGGEGDDIDFTDPDEWRMGDTSIVDGRFVRSVVTTPDSSGQATLEADLPHAWQNIVQASDVNNNGDVTAGDALAVINELGRRTFSNQENQMLNDPMSLSLWPGIYYDQNGDDRSTAIDALRVINQLARLLQVGSEEVVAAAEQIKAEPTAALGRPTVEFNDLAMPPKVSSFGSTDQVGGNAANVDDGAGAMLSEDAPQQGEVDVRAVDALLSNWD